MRYDGSVVEHHLQQLNNLELYRVNRYFACFAYKSLLDAKIDVGKLRDVGEQPPEHHGVAAFTLQVVHEGRAGEVRVGVDLLHVAAAQLSMMRESKQLDKTTITQTTPETTVSIVLSVCTLIVRQCTADNK